MNPDSFRYDGKRALVVGGATGMGAATAALVQQLGAEVVVMDFAPVTLDGVTAISLDLRDKDGIDAALADAQKRLTRGLRDEDLMSRLTNRRPQSVARVRIGLDEEDTAHGWRVTRNVVEVGDVTAKRVPVAALLSPERLPQKIRGNRPGR